MELMLPKGTRDLLPEQQILRNEIIAKMRKKFEEYGFSPVETPAFERLEVLTAKFAAGEESDAAKEIFRFKDQGKRDLGLKFDLTVPLSRLVGMNPNLKMPFKRYQIEKVYRDGPVESNRYREFLQCDADTVGVKSVIADAEVLALAKSVFRELGIEAEIRVNDRKLLFEIMRACGVKERDREFALVEIDKLDKKEASEVRKSLEEKIGKENAEKIFELISVKGSNEEILAGIEKVVGKTEGIAELRELVSYCNEFGVQVKVVSSLVRGMGYYTGPIFEAMIMDKSVKGSIAGGGRYDKMIGEFLGKGTEFPATGISFGIERIFDALQARENGRKTTVDLYIINVGEGAKKKGMQLLEFARNAGIRADMDLLGRGISKNLDYASKLGIPFCLIVGAREIKEGKFTLRDMKTGKETKIGESEIAEIRVA
ncbi:MAG: histidine--tRNA ligase [archaeon]